MPGQVYGGMVDNTLCEVPPNPSPARVSYVGSPSGPFLTSHQSDNVAFILHAFKLSSQVVFIQVSILYLLGHFALALTSLLGILEFESMLIHGEAHSLGIVSRVLPVARLMNIPLHSRHEARDRL